MALSHAARVELTEAFVNERMAGMDSSHDYWHVHRVRNLTLAAAADQLTAEEAQLAELAALTHDMADPKYSDDPAADRAALQRFLAGPLQLTAAQQDLVLFVIDNLGFREELGRSEGRGSGGPQQQQQEQQQEGRQRVLDVVQDADRLDAIGAIGIARCLTFGGRFDRVLHDPAVPPRAALTQQQYADKAARQTTMNHFHEKLFKLKDLMRTAAGRRLAESRHAFMQEFVARFHHEWEAAA